MYEAYQTRLRRLVSLSELAYKYDRNKFKQFIASKLQKLSRQPYQITWTTAPNQIAAMCSHGDTDESIVVMTRYHFNFDTKSIQYFTKYRNIDINILKIIIM